MWSPKLRVVRLAGSEEERLPWLGTGKGFEAKVSIWVERRTGHSGRGTT